MSEKTKCIPDHLKAFAVNYHALVARSAVNIYIHLNVFSNFVAFKDRECSFML